MSVLTIATELATCSYQRAVVGLKALAAFDEHDAAILERWESGETSANQIARDLRLAGFQTSATMVKDHRRNECICSVNV